MATTKQKIMVVDDEVGIRDILYQLLTNKGYEVITLGDGKQAIEMLKRIRPDLIVLDYRMPQMNGLETLKKIREFDEKVRVVMLTAFSTPEVEKEALMLGVDGFVSKDISTSPFIRKLEEVINRLTLPVKPTTRGGKVMVVDDDSTVRGMLKEFLAKQGYEVLTAASGEEALEKLPMWNPAIVLLDVTMPGMDGLLCLERIKKLNPEIGIIVMTGLESMETARQAINLGAYEFIQKPFNMEYLATALWSKMIFVQ